MILKALGGAHPRFFLLPSFLWASKEKKGWRAEPSAIKNSPRDSADQKSTLATQSTPNR